MSHTSTKLMHRSMMFSIIKKKLQFANATYSREAESENDSLVVQGM